MIGSDNCVVPCRFPHRPNTYDLMDRGGVTSTNGRPQQGGQKNARVGHSRPDRPIGDLSEQEFQARFCISNTILIQLTNGETLSLVNLSNNMIYFTKEQFVVRLRFPIP